MINKELISECSYFFYTRSDLINSFFDTTHVYTNLELKKVDCIDESFIESYIKSDLKEYEEKYCNKLNLEAVDSSEYYDNLSSREQWLYQELGEYKNIFILQSLSTLCNYFEKSLRELLLQLGNEFKNSNKYSLTDFNEAHFLKRSEILKFSPVSLVKNIKSELKFSIDENVLELYSDLINTYKHGQGNSFKKIQNSKFVDKDKIKFFSKDLPFSVFFAFNHNIFDLKKEYINEYSNAIIQFWKSLITETFKFID